MFTTASSLDGSQRKLEVLDALCSMEEEGSVEDEDDETEGSEQGGGSAAGERSRQVGSRVGCLFLVVP